MKKQDQEIVCNIIRIGVSSCLLGAKVRFDGQHKRNTYINDLLSEYFYFVPFCPEVAIGMGTPREPIRLVDDQGNIRVVETHNPDRDHTQQLREYSGKTASTMEYLCGFIFKKDSPTCGMERVKVYAQNGMPEKKGTGIFAEQVRLKNPLLPLEEEGRLNDPVLRENFVNRVYAYARWKDLTANGLTKSGLIDFHTRHKYLILAHHQKIYYKLGRELSEVKRDEVKNFSEYYISSVMTALREPANRKSHVNVLQHMLGFLRSCLDREDRAELVDAIKSYSRGEYPLVVPIALLQHHFRRYPHPFIEHQVYLNPHPRELMLRNSI